jgi:hypothetical protein
MLGNSNKRQIKPTKQMNIKVSINTLMYPSKMMALHHESQVFEIINFRTYERQLRM